MVTSTFADKLIFDRIKIKGILGEFGHGFTILANTIADLYFQEILLPDSLIKIASEIMVAGTSSLHANSFNLLAIDNNEVSGFHDDNHVKTGSSESQHYAKNNIGASKPQSLFLNIISQSPSGEKLGKLTRHDQHGHGGGLTNATPDWVKIGRES